MKPVLEKSRIFLTPFELEDIALLHQTFTHPFIRKYLFDDEIISKEMAKEIMAINEEKFDKENWGLWKITTKNDNAYSGFAGLWQFFNEDQPQLIFGLLPVKKGLGYATEASIAILDYAFTHLNYRYLTASFDTINVASEKVCQRIRMVREGERKLNSRMTTFYRIERPQ